MNEFGPDQATRIAAITEGEFRRIVRERLRILPDSEQGDHLLNPEFRDWVLREAKRPAAVLVPIVPRAGQLRVILTKRPDHLKSHSGQIAFPGGKIDDSDRSIEDAALREAQEEIDLDRRHVEILGRLPDYHSGSGYRISPVLSIVNAAARLQANPEEVEYIFEVPLAFLMDPANHRKGSREFAGRKRFFMEMPYRQHHIWGITANILHMMHERLFK